MKRKAMKKTLVLVLAAGDGSRMRSTQTKVLHRVAGRSLIGHVLSTARNLSPSSLAVVIGAQAHQALLSNEVHSFTPQASLFIQDKPLGTAHAVLAARDALSTGDYDCLLILYGDTPLIESTTCGNLCRAIEEGHGIALLGFHTQSPTGYGRIIQDHCGNAIGIREEKDASPEEKGLTLCNGGAMAFDGKYALDLLDSVTNHNAKQEFYLTDCVSLATQRGLTCAVIESTEHEVLGVNDRNQLAQAEAHMQNQLRHQALKNGVTLRAPETIFLSVDTTFGTDCTLEPYVICGPGVILEDRVTIRSFSHLENAHIQSEASIGPFARLRDHVSIGSASRIGNFVELKNATIGSETKINHLAYIGDSSLGKNVNIGAGTITCNYDGHTKHHTTIEDNAFIGSNSSLVAPITIGTSALVGSGSVITKNVPAHSLALGRAKQILKEGWATRFWRKTRS
jgi:bifunctional UDP-N-acetylglucosamine pyrophosphorylase/glucosamine-1-phosphate N-acetyltransferase